MSINSSCSSVFLAEDFFTVPEAEFDARKEYDAQVREKFGAEADNIGHVEVYEISEYGETPSREFLDILEK